MYLTSSVIEGDLHHWPGGEVLWQKMNGINNCLINLAVPGFEADFIWPKKILVI